MQWKKNYERLFIHVIKQAVNDYKRALRKNDNYTMATIEKFFLSDWGQWLSYGYGEYIIEKCKKSVKKRKF